MTPRTLLFLCAFACLASFAWGMISHFERHGRPSRFMTIVGLLGFSSALLNLAAIVRRPIPAHIESAALYLTAIVIFWSAVRVTRHRLAACGQQCISSAIVTAGPYSRIRHPFYLAYNLAWLAGLIATGWWPLALTALVMSLLYDYAARTEEAAFLSGDLRLDYAVYMRRTGRYLPRLAVNTPADLSANTKPDRAGRRAA